MKLKMEEYDQLKKELKNNVGDNKNLKKLSLNEKRAYREEF